MLELRELRNFVVVAERLNISSAANTVNLSQPALSRQIQALEKKLGVDLFERVGKRLVLTAEGADLALQAAELIERAQDLMQRTARTEPEHSGTLRIGASPQTISWLLSPAMARFRAVHPRVDLM
ncbi:MAG: LysR family transcriptional regulator, partial [Rhodobiaceae bacterium]|nr:LysR family transcriptional regulator [Rhodobiaceae bacterium]